MKKILSLFLGFILFACCGNPDGYKITASIDGLEDGTVMVLKHSNLHTELPVIAEEVLKNGKVVFTGKLEEPHAFLIQVKDTEGGITAMIYNDNVLVTANAVRDTSSGKISFNYTDCTVEGSETHNIYLQKIQPRIELDNYYEKVQKDCEDIINKARDLRASDDKKAYAEFRETEEYKNYVKIQSETYAKMADTMMKMIEDNSDSFWGPFLLLYNTVCLIPEDKSLYEGLSEEAKNSFYGKQVYQELYPVGSKVKDFTSVDSNGNEKTLSDICKGKKYVLIDFWASWCAPCRRELPNVKALYEKYKDKGFDIVSVSIDADEAAWRKALEEEKLEWHNFRDVSVSEMYKVMSIPAIYLVDGDMVLIAENLRGEELAKKLEELFK